MEDAVSEKLDKIETTVSKAHQALRELFSTLIEMQQMTSALKNVLRPRFLESSPAKRAFGEQIKQILDDILMKGSKQVLIRMTGRLDGELVDRLEKIMTVGGVVKIIIPELEKREAASLKRMVESYGAEIMIHPMMHARIFCVHRDGRPWGVIIGSGDINSNSLNGKLFDAAIWSNHPDIIKPAVDLFNAVWENEKAEKLS
ncbi:hypothetical protein GTO27_10080 [Candidatus Bathyarchaeota archaeon]|nr:hypothetical protein [Candidatus Bathyarchaeota archaeon]